MKKQFSLLPLLMGLTLMFFAACKPGEDEETVISNAYVLNEGMWGGNDADISALDINTGAITNNYFSSQNGRGLGDLGQDLVVYGGKMYCTVHTSNTVEVIDPHTGKSLQQISMGSRGPRYMACANGKVFVTCYDKTVVRIDTTSLSIDGTCALSGMKPEGICASNGKLYVCNGWETTDNGDYQYDNTLSVVDIASFTEIKKIQVGLNPAKVKTLANGNVVLCYSGDYLATPAGMMIIDPATDTPSPINVQASNFDVYQNTIIAYYFDWSTYQGALAKIDGTTLAISDFTPQGVNFVSFYGININPSNGDIYITDAQNYQSNGDVHCFTSNGEHRFSAETTVGPSKVVFF